MSDNEKKYNNVFSKIKNNIKNKRNNPFRKTNNSYNSKENNSSNGRNGSRMVYILLSVFIAIAVIGWTIENFVYPPFRFASFLQTVSSFATLAFLYLTPVTNGGVSGPNDNN